MNPVMQTVFGSGDNGEKAGNCFRACLASILEIQIDDIPDIENLAQDRWFPVFHNWLKEQGYEYLGWGNPDNLADSKYASGIEGYVIVCGGSPRGYSRGHAVVFKDAVMVHDPHPSNLGITHLYGFYMIEKIK